MSGRRLSCCPRALTNFRVFEDFGSFRMGSNNPAITTMPPQSRMEGSHRSLRLIRCRAKHVHFKGRPRLCRPSPPRGRSHNRVAASAPLGSRSDSSGFHLARPRSRPRRSALRIVYDNDTGKQAESSGSSKSTFRARVSRLAEL